MRRYVFLLISALTLAIMSSCTTMPEQVQMAKEYKTTQELKQAAHDLATQKPNSADDDQLEKGLRKIGSVYELESSKDITLKNIVVHENYVSYRYILNKASDKQIVNDDEMVLEAQNTISLTNYTEPKIKSTDYFLAGNKSNSAVKTINLSGLKVTMVPQFSKGTHIMWQCYIEGKDNIIQLNVPKTLSEAEITSLISGLKSSRIR